MNASPTAEHASRVRLLEAEPELARSIPEAERAVAERTLTLPVREIPAGEAVSVDPDQAVGLLLLRGAVWREVRIGAGGAPQLLGPGAVLLGEPEAGDLLAPATTTMTLAPTRFAVLERRYLVGCARWPGVARAMHARVALQERDLALQVAVCQLPRVDERLMTLMWHLAERWGRVHQDGVHVPLRLTHATLGRFVGARRPTVSLALSQLRETGRIDRRDDSTWVLLGSPPSELLPAPVAEAAPDLFPVSGRVRERSVRLAPALEPSVAATA